MVDDATPPAPAAGGHPWFAALYDALGGRQEERLLGPLRGWVAGEARRRVLEIGAGTGRNVPYYDRGADLTLTDPDPYMLRRLRARTARFRRTADIRRASAEALPFAGASFDAVVCTLVLCSVADPDRALAEVRRVVRPGGTFRFVEHVRAGGWVRHVQEIATPIWSRLCAGCHLNRPTLATIEAAGFRTVRLEEHRIAPGMPLLAGSAEAPG